MCSSGGSGGHVPAAGGKKPWPWGGRFGCRRARRPAGTPTPICVTRFWCRSLAAAKASFSNEVVLDTKSFFFVSFLNEAFIVDFSPFDCVLPPPPQKKVRVRGLGSVVSLG